MAESGTEAGTGDWGWEVVSVRVGGGPLRSLLVHVISMISLHPGRMDDIWLQYFNVFHDGHFTLFLGQLIGPRFNAHLF